MAFAGHRLCQTFGKAQTVVVSTRNAQVAGADIITSISQDEPKITLLLHQLRAGDSSVRGELMDAVHTTLRRIARRYLAKERADHTLQPTALVNEVYLKLFRGSQVAFVDRAHFFAVVSQAMRRILVDHARMRSAARRDGERLPWDTMVQVETESAVERMNLLNLDLALDALAQENRSLAELIEMRYFGGMTAEETAEVVGRSVHAVRHDLRIAHAWLRRELARHR
jgi:RNA polymerase sigma factor (TIGR02999 family)